MSLPEDEANQDFTPEDETFEVNEVDQETMEAEEKESEEKESEEKESEEKESEEKESEESDSEVELSDEDALAKALEDVVKFKDMAMRAEAEMQNMQRRTARDVENAHKFGLERFLQNLLPVIDSLEKAIEVTEQLDDDSDESTVEGIRLCHKLLVDVLGRENIEVIDPMGEPFDPNEHQAMSMVENPDMEPNSVFAVVQKGYKLNDRLVRAAMVMVTKAPAEPTESSDENEKTSQ